MKKSSVAKGVTRRVSAILIIALAVLFTASYQMVQNTIYNKTKSYSKSVVKSYSDLLLEESEKQSLPLNESFSPSIIEIGDKMCRWYDIDFAYLFIPDIKTGKIKYISVSQNKRFNKINPTDRYVGKVTEYSLTNEEVEVWKGKRTISNSVTQSKSGHEISTMIRIKDKYGNWVMAGVDQSYEGVNAEIRRLFSILAIVIILVILGVYFLVYIVIKRKVSKPAEVISRSMNDFITDRGHFSQILSENGSNEYSMIASAFNRMTNDINEYINHIDTLTAERERQKTELDIAAKIQKGFLPKEHLNSDFYELRTTMIPAKDVGGDFYYYMPLEDEKVLLVIADVSGKGISAALFMAVTLTLTVQFAKMNLSPSEILKNVNDTLAQNNSEMLFATEFVGIYDTKNMAFTYSNAGHNIPYIILESDIKALDGARGALLGLYEGEEYTDETAQLNVGDTIFLYTDGVTESTDKNNSFFGEERLKNELKNFRNSNAYNPISFIGEKLSEFSDSTEQHDDITILTLNAQKTYKLSLDIDTNEFSKIKELILSLSIERTEQLKLCLCAEEWFINICSYAFPEKIPENEKIEFSLMLSDRIKMRFEDGGMPFNPLEHIIDIENYDFETQVGGLGNFIAVSNTDDAVYQYKNGKNILTLIRFNKQIEN